MEFLILGEIGNAETRAEDQLRGPEAVIARHNRANSEAMLSTFSAMAPSSSELPAHPRARKAR